MAGTRKASPGQEKPWRKTCDLGILGLLWSLNTIVQTLWLWLDRSVPSWDPAKHLIGSLNYWWTLQHPDWTSDLWWERFWMLSSSYAPLFYILTAPLQNWLGPGADQATMINLGFNALLLGSVYGLGRYLFRAEVGLWAAAFCLLFPRLYTASLDYLLDYGAMTLAVFCLYSLVCWQGATHRWQQWSWASLVGLALGSLLLLKQTLLVFFCLPLLGVTIVHLWQRQWEHLLQFCLIPLISLKIIWPWFSTNWLFMIGAGGNSLGNAATNEGDPRFTTLAAWTYYLKDLPVSLSWPLLIVPGLGLVGYGVQHLRSQQLGSQQLRSHHLRSQQLGSQQLGSHHPRSQQLESQHSGSEHLEPLRRGRSKGFPLFLLFLLLLYILGGYVCWSLLPNKDNRYVMAYLPALAVVLAYGMTFWRGRWRSLPWVTMILAVLLMLANLFPLGALGDRLGASLAPNHARPPHLGAAWPHEQVIDHVIQTTPYQLANLGLLTSSIQVNAETLNYYGSLRNFQVYTRGVGNRRSFAEVEARSLDWFIAQVDPEARVLTQPEPDNRIQLLQTIDQSPAFHRDRTWLLPDHSQLYLYRRNSRSVQVQPLEAASAPSNFKLSGGKASGGKPQTPDPQILEPQPIYLSQIQLPERVPPGVPVPVTYSWQGTWRALHRGMVLLTWRQQLPPQPRSQPPTTLPAPDFWIHDHGLGLGTLRPGPIQANQFTLTATESHTETHSDRWFQVQEHTAMLPPAQAVPGVYGLEATYLDPQTHRLIPLDIPPASLIVDPQASPPLAPEVDWVSQLRQLAIALPKGGADLDPVFDTLGQINLYDPIQSYLVQAEKTLEARLEEDPKNLNYAYGLVLSRVMQRKAEEAIAALHHVITLDPDNPYGYAYLAFVHLYALQPKAAEAALKPALILAPGSPEIQGLSAVASLLQGDVINAWFTGQRALASQ